jgi:hypothetical protein
MRKLRRRLLRWNRYGARTYWNPRVTRPRWMHGATAITFGHRRAWDAWAVADENRRCRAAARWSPGPQAALVLDERRLWLDDEGRRIAEHAYACWDGCDDLHTCADCGEQEDVCVPDVSTWRLP